MIRKGWKEEKEKGRKGWRKRERKKNGRRKAGRKAGKKRGNPHIYIYIHLTGSVSLIESWMIHYWIDLNYIEILSMGA